MRRHSFKGNAYAIVPIIRLVHIVLGIFDACCAAAAGATTAEALPGRAAMVATMAFLWRCLSQLGVAS